MRHVTYHNPVYPHSCPDPFVLKALGTYWAYCTGFWHDGRCFGVLHSPDLVHWEVLDGALAPLEGDHTCYWAPEVSYLDGRYCMYYSVGDEARMQIRVATAAHPAGPFEDSGRRLTSEPFAIDAHVFTDADGARYLFYAVDFTDHPRVGTGTVMDRLVDPFTTAGAPRPVTRAQYDWQIYDPQRAEKDGVCWHTLEGPFVLRHRDRYYQMFSGGNWQNPSYGVSYATTTALDAPGEWQQVCDGVHTLPVLRTLRDDGVIGPGHNSVVRGPDNRQLYCVYHRWDTGTRQRVMAIDRLDWVGDRLTVLGPTNRTEPAPIPPTLDDLTRWHTEGGAWRQSPTTARQEATVPWAAAWLSLPASSFLLELWLRTLPPADGGAFGIGLEAAGGPVWQLKIAGPDRRATLRTGPSGGLPPDGNPPDGGSLTDSSLREGQSGGGPPTSGPLRLDLPATFDSGDAHLLRLEVDGTQVAAALDDIALQWQGHLPAAPTRLSLFTEDTALEVTGFALTTGWEMPFPGQRPDPATGGWRQPGADGCWQLAGGALHCTQAQPYGTRITKPAPEGDYELVVTARLADVTPKGTYGIAPLLDAADRGPLFTVEPDRDGRWCLRCSDGDRTHPLPHPFDPTADQHFRFRRIGDDLTIQLEGQPLATLHLPAPSAPHRIGLYARATRATFALVRVTTIPG